MPCLLPCNNLIIDVFEGKRKENMEASGSQASLHVFFQFTLYTFIWAIWKRCGY